MKNKKTLLVIILVFVLLLGGAYALYNQLGQNMTADQMIVHAAQAPSAESSPAAEGDASAQEESEAIPAPDFRVYNKDGSTVQFSDFFGKPIVLNFWANWCGPCQREMPDFNEKYAELGDDVHFIMVNMTDGMRETIDTASAFIEKNGYSFPVFFDTSGEAAAAYGVYSLPTSYFISADGHIIAHAMGTIDAAALQKGIDMISD